MAYNSYSREMPNFGIFSINDTRDGPEKVLQGGFDTEEEARATYNRWHKFSPNVFLCQIVVLEHNGGRK